MCNVGTLAALSDTFSSQSVAALGSDKLERDLWPTQCADDDELSNQLGQCGWRERR